MQRDDAFANIVLPQLLRERRLRGRDAALATELTYGTLRTLGQLDAIIAAAAGRPVARIDPPVRDALRLGAYQVLHTRVPAHAAVATTVDLVRAEAPAAAGFANAVLRRVAKDDLTSWLARLTAPVLGGDAPAPAGGVPAGGVPAGDPPAGDPPAVLALTHAHPEWIVRAFAEALGEAGDELAALLAADNARPEVHLCARPGRVGADELAAETGGRVGAYSPYAVYLPSGAPGEIDAVRRGLAQVQDEGSQLVTGALAAAPLAGRDQHWLDLCAGPGGKAALLGALAGARGGDVTAIEVAAHRAELVRRATVGLPVRVVCADGRGVAELPGLPAEGFDRVLVDAPCTGLGALRRRPESRWRRQPADLPPLTKLQRELLVAALRAVRPGGLVGYVTCSPHLAETRVSVREAVRRSGMAVAQLDARALLPAAMPGLGAGPYAQLWPHRHGTDAMFLAVLRRE